VHQLQLMQNYLFTIVAVVTGLTVGTPIWVDLWLAAVTGGTASVSIYQSLLKSFKVKVLMHVFA